MASRDGKKSFRRLRSKYFFDEALKIKSDRNESDMIHNVTPDDIEKFITDGYLCIKDAFPQSIADEARKLLWTQTGCDPTNRSTWTKPVIRLGVYTNGPFLQACNTPVLHQAFDTLVGKNRWQPLGGLGTFCFHSILLVGQHTL